MRKYAAAFLLLLAGTSLHAELWMENDYISGSNGFKKDSIAFFTRITTRTVIAPGAAVYKIGGPYTSAVYSFRLPVMYSGDRFFLSFKPFIYPRKPGMRSGAAGAKVHTLFSLSESQDLSYVHLTLSGAAARQNAVFAANGTRAGKTFSQGAAEVQLETGFYDQFFFLASAAGFSRPPGVKNSGLTAPVLDQSDLAYLGAFRTIHAIPEWALALQFARNMAPDFDSHIYGGFSRIVFRQAGSANSAIFGFKLRVNENVSLDLAYNFYKQAELSGKNYYKLFAQMFF